MLKLLPILVFVYLNVAQAAKTNDVSKESRNSSEPLKPGRCPAKLIDKSLCPEEIYDQCQHDSDCNGDAKCCFTGCAKVCVAPLSSGCELTRENSLRRGRAIGLPDPNIDLPRCEKDGTFSAIQCQGGKCFCVDSYTGFEIPGTRAETYGDVNCSNPAPCSGYQCRMLCPFDFDLDDKGCPMCQCRDPCVNVTCPKDTSCIIEETSCSDELCPPLPTCKQPRSLSSLCPLGEPLMVDATAQRPFLCGTNRGKPSCPPLYKCIVGRGHEYGVCCAAVEELFKPGTCPVEGHSKNVIENWEDKDALDVEVRCGASCEHDLQCPSTQKCCISEVCGQHCVQPANLTACLQQRMIAELMIVSEKEGRGYIPQCDEDTGLYLPKQCSRNGMVCWCTDEQGHKFPRSMGSAHEVQCHNITESGRSLRCGDDPECDSICEYGYIVDDAGCTTCECEDPCDQLECPDGSHCVMRDDPSCSGNSPCLGVPMCITNDSSLLTQDDDGPTVASVINPTEKKPRCPSGKEPLSVGGIVGICDQSNPCPLGFVCTPSSSNSASSCCPEDNIIDNTKPGQCPFIRAADGSSCSKFNPCYSDSECAQDKKCCIIAECGVPVCVDPIPSENNSMNHDILQGPTMCEYLRDLVQLEGVSLALPTPSCDSNGAYEPVQCNALGQCWCVDDFGSPVPNTKASTRELVTCHRVRMSMSCGDLVCRLGCDYGFVLDSDNACPICECRDPCQNVDCGLLHECQMVDVPCIDGVCPPIPQCVPTPRKKGSIEVTCSKGHPYTVRSTNVTLSCSPRARALECPTGYICEAGENTIEGVCCPSPEATEKPGQCPYLMPSKSDTCDLECSEDAHCQDEKKCCSNGCGTYCVEPMTLTACQHQRVLLEHRAREAEIPAEKVFLPQCDEQGDFFPTQCHPGTLTCWCVDSQGLEIAGTRVSSPAEPNCQEPLVCPAMNCNLACLHGYQLDTSGCPVCSCRDPCEEVTCSSPSEECRIVHVACVGEPCPPLPVCLPKLENPCLSGTPLAVNGSLVECGPQGQSCPSSHKCHLSPLGEYALCCPKPKEACFNDKDSGVCEGSIQRWFFDPNNNRCERFRYGGCGGNLNNFETKDECQQACPALTSCQKSRHKNLKYSKQDKLTFLPKCDKISGSWLPEQCLDELGVCWCVTPEGDQVPGTLTRGAPSCQSGSRTARFMKFNFDPSQPTNMICGPGQIVHVCDKELCSNKVCLSHPDAICRVNPCGGCQIQFVDSFNAPVNCEIGLTDCQKELQKVLNSEAFARPNHIISDILIPPTSVPNQNVNYDIDLLRNVDVYYPNEPVMKSVPWNPHDDPVGSAIEINDNELPKEEMELPQDSSGRRTRDVVLNPPMLSPLTEPHLVDPNDLREDRLLAYPTEGIIPIAQVYPPSPDRNIFEAVPLRDALPKPGMCPSPPLDFSLLQCNPTQDCTVDMDCPTDSKCCFTGCGTMCLQPAGTSVTSVGMTLQPAQCHSDGSWVREQRSGDLAWCVDTKGRPIHETLTRGHVRCGPNGQILEQISVGFVCPRGVRPMVCVEECKKATCYSHPDAVCIADPCNQCRVSFYQPTGELVSCDDQCSQTLSTGMCRASFKRYFYNSTAKQCQQFIYGGCQGNDNNFLTIDECRSSCEKPVMSCDQPVQVGHCTNGEARWYYNKGSRKCEPFLYSGCGGNENNYRSKEACEAMCPDLVLCPYWSASSMEPKPCSRSSACANQTCHGYPDTICKVDPCDCTTKFVNLEGEEVSCMMPTEKPRTRVAFTYEEESTRHEEFTPNSITEGRPGPVTIFLEGEPTLTRCQLLQRHLRESNSRRYIAQCDAEGHFIPTQCYSAKMDVFILDELDQGQTINEVESGPGVPKCWCVDEIGRKTEPTVYFNKGERHCDIVSVESVVVTLGFKGKDVGMDKLGKKKGSEIKKQVGMLLQQLSAETLETEVNIIDLPDLTQVKFTLLGDNKVDVAYQLEDQVRRGGLALKLDKLSIPADLRASWFHHQVSEPRWTAPAHLASLNLGDKVEPREVVSQVVALEPPYLAAMVVLTVISAVLICGLIMGVVLYRRHITGQYPKAPRGSMQSLAFSDASMDRRSIESRLSTPSSMYRNPKGVATTIKPPISTVTTIEDEYRSGVH